MYYTEEDTTIETVLEAFEEYLNKGEVIKAKEILNSNQQHLESSVYFFNLGRVYAADKNWPEARIAFLKSQKMLARKETLSNLEIIEKQMVIAELESPRSIKDYLVNSTYFLGTEMVLTINLLLLVGGLWMIQKSKDIRKLITIATMILLLSALSLWTHYWPWAVAENEIHVYHGPSEIFEKVELIPQGMKFLGLEKDSWIHVIYPSRFEGWIKKENISEL